VTCITVGGLGVDFWCVERVGNSPPWRLEVKEKSVYENLASKQEGESPSTWVPSDFFRVCGRVGLEEVGE
jgi:hypothetical protein